MPTALPIGHATYSRIGIEPQSDKSVFEHRTHHIHASQFEPMAKTGYRATALKPARSWINSLTASAATAEKTAPYRLGFVTKSPARPKRILLS